VQLIWLAIRRWLVVFTVQDTGPAAQSALQPCIKRRPISFQSWLDSTASFSLVIFQLHHIKKYIHEHPG
jgi:hypothetical protein